MARPELKTKPHAVLVPWPAQGHVTPLLQLAKLLHYNGFFITFVNTDFNHRRLLRSGGLYNLPDFRFDSIPDGLPHSDADVTQDCASLCASTAVHCLEPFCNLISKINGSGDCPPVSCIIPDGAMTFALTAAERFGVPCVLFWTAGAGAVLCHAQYRRLVKEGYIPLKDMSQLTNGYMETVIDWVPRVSNMRLRDFPSFIRTTDPKDIMINFLADEIDAAPRCKAMILNTFDAIDHDVIEALSAIFPRVLAVGPLHTMLDHAHDKQLESVKSNLWKEDSSCIEWLDTKEPESVVYVNFGSITVLTEEQLTEFAWGLANSKMTFLWIVRPDIVAGDTEVLLSEFLEETKERGMVISWCPQKRVLKHPAIGGFLTHCGWNSTIESITNGIPVICWPFFADQQTVCRFSCVEWGIGMEIDSDVKRDHVELLVKELMKGEKGKKMKANVMAWKKKAEEAIAPNGSSYLDLKKLIDEVLLS